MYPNNMFLTHGIFIHNQIRHIAQAGCTIKVIAPVPYSPKVLWNNDKWKNYGNIPLSDTMDGIEVAYPRYINIPGKWSHLLSTYSMCSPIKINIDQVIRKFKPHIIHAHTATPDGYLGLTIKMKYNLPLVCSLRGSDIHTYPYNDSVTYRLTRKVILNADQILSVSDALRISAEQIAKPKNPIKVVYNGCELPPLANFQIKRGEIRSQLGIGENDVAIIFVGDIDKVKGIFELMEAFKLLKSKYPHLHLILLGDGPDRQPVLNMISSGIDNANVHLIGKIPHDDVYHWLRASDLFVLPTYNEGLPNALLEAMACGLPVIATNVGGIPEVVRHGQNGILIEARNVNTLYQSIEKMLADPEIARNMGSSANRLIQQNFSWLNNAGKMMEIYKELI